MYVQIGIYYKELDPWGCHAEYAECAAGLENQESQRSTLNLKNQKELML